MKNIHTTLLTILLLLSTGLAQAQATIYLDGDTPATGSNLGTTPLVTAFGTITFTGEFRTGGDVDATAAGSVGNIFDGSGSSPAVASFAFDFDVCSFSFVYGGNSGNITVEALDSGNAVINSFFQADTGASQPAGPQNLVAAIPPTRTLRWSDTAGSFVFLDNIEITTCTAQLGPPQSIPTLSPLAIISLILALGLFGFAVIRR